MRRNNSETQASLGTDPTPVPFACSPRCSGARARSWPSQEECPRVSVYVSSSCSVIFFLEMGWGPKASVQISHHLSEAISLAVFQMDLARLPRKKKQSEDPLPNRAGLAFSVGLCLCFPLTSFFLTGQLRILPEPGTQYSYLVNILSWSTQDWADQILLCCLLLYSWGLTMELSTWEEHRWGRKSNCPAGVASYF